MYKVFKSKGFLDRHEKLQGHAQNNRNEERDYLIKWHGFDESSSTWEPSSSVPVFIQKFYENKDKLGKPLPKPVIKKSKKVPTLVYHLSKAV